MDIVVTIPEQTLSGLKSQIITEITEGNLIARPMAAQVAEHISVSDIANEISVVDVALEISVSDIAGEFSASDIAGEFSAEDIAEYVDMRDLSERVADNIDAADVAEHLKDASIDWSEVVDHEAIASRVVRALREDPDFRRTMLVSLSNLISEHLAAS
jgi:hypothetical protein